VSSHLGYYPDSQTQRCFQVAAQVDGIDFIGSVVTRIFPFYGGSLLYFKNPGGKQTTIFQVGKSGIFLGGALIFSKPMGKAVRGCRLKRPLPDNEI